MGKKSTFLEMHNAVGGSYSSQERVKQEKENQQKKAEAQKNLNQQAATDNAIKNQVEGQIKTVNRLMSSPSRTSVQVPQSKKSVASGSDGSSASQLAGADQQISQYEKIIKDLRKKKKPVGMGNTDQATRDYNSGIDSQIQSYRNDIGQIQQMQVNRQIQAADNDPDFTTKSAYSSTKKGDGYFDRFGTEMGLGYGDLLYEYINDKDGGIREQIRQKQPNFAYGYELMDDKEVAMYNYLYSTAGKDVAEQYLDSIEDDINQRKGAQLYQGVEGNTFKELLFGIGSGLDQFGEGLKGAGDMLTGEDSYSAPSARQYASASVREDLGNSGGNLPEWMGGASLGQAGYDLVTNISHMLPTMLVSGAMNVVAPGSGAVVGDALIGATSAGGAYQEAINAGHSVQQSRNYAVAMGASEAALQYVLGGISSLGGKISGNVAEKAVEKIGNGVARAALKTGINMASEGIEEGIQEALEPIFQRVLLGEEGDIDWSQVAYAATLGAVTAGLMEGGKNFTNMNETTQTDTQVDQASQSTGTDTQQETAGTPLQGETADPRHVAAQQEQAAQSRQEATEQRPSMDSMMDGIGRQQTQPNPTLENLSPYPTPDTAQPQQVTEIDPLLEGIQQPPVDTAPSGRYNDSAITVPGAAVGNSGITYTADNKPVQFRYAVVPLESLVTSNDQYGNVNSAYPAELQPRDRTRVTSQTQINSISRNLNPALLAESPTAQNGAPIIRGDGVVIGGNGRVGAITQAYSAGRAAEYQQFITNKAAELGIDPATLPANPVLVRVTDGVDNYSKLASSLNASTTASYSATEVANADASRIGDIIQYLSVSEDGEINTAENRDFIQKFVSQVVPATERGDVTQANGQLSQAGKRRIQNALFAYAYGDTALVERLAESTDNNAKNITNAMVATAGKVARLQTEIGRGEVQDLGLQHAITDAVNLYLDAKAGKQTVENTAGQLILGDNGAQAQYDGLTVNLTRFMESNSRSGLQIRTFIDILVDVNMNMSAETASQVSLFGNGGQQTQEGLYNEAVAVYEQQRNGKGRIPEKFDFSQYRQYRPGELAAGMDGGRTEGNPGSAAPDGGIPQAVQGTVPGGQRGVTDHSPSIKGTGAAEANFTGKPAYNATLSETNAQPDRATDVRPMELPKTDISGNPISEVTGNVYASKFTPDEFASLMEEPTARGDFSYAKITNDHATQSAIDTISAAGDWETAYNQWAKDVGAGKAGAEMSARGALFLNHFAQEGNKTQWLNTLADMQDLGTNTAQGLQAMRLVRELNPPDKIRFVEMATKRLGQKMGVDFTVDQSLYDAYNNATTDEARNAALEDIQQNIADQIPSTALDKWNALRYTNMLGNLKTNVRNIAGNVGAGAMYRVKDQIAATMEGVLYKATGGKFERTKSHTVTQELLNACKQDFDQVSGIVSDGGKYGTQGGFSDQFTQGVMDKRRIFKSDSKVIDTLLKPLEGYRKATDWMMNNQYFGDEAFGKAAYARSLAGYLKAHGVTDTDLSKVDTALMDKARAYVVQEAQEATFHDNSALARTMSKLKKDTGVIGEGIMPFTKTPANVLTRAYEFSPLGFIETAVDGVKAAKGIGDITGVDVVNSLAKSLTGTGIFALGAWLRNQGFLTGGPDGDEDKDYFDQLNGDQNYALRFTINGKTYNFTFDWLTPAAMPLFMGGQFMDIMNQGFENITFADLEKVFTSIADPMLQMSMLQSLNDSLDNIKYTDNNLGQFFINAAVSYLTQGFANTMLGQIERSTEKNRMTTYVDKDSQVPAWMQRQIGSFSQKIPGWDYQQTEYRNAWGETEENEGGLLYNLLSPGYISEEKSNALSEELYRLNDAGVEGNVFPDTPDTTVSYTDKNGDRHEDYNLTAAEADTLKEVSGRTSATLLGDLIESDMYNAMTDQKKTDVISAVYDYARELGRTEAIEGYNGMDSWMENLGDNAADTILNKVVTSSFSDSFNSLTNSWNYGKDTGSAISGLDQAYSLYTTLGKEEQQEFRKANGGRIGYFLDAKEAGVSTERFADLYSTYRSLDNNEGLTIKEKAQQWSYTLSKAQKSGELTASQANTLKDSMVFRYSNVATTEKFDNLVESGMSTDSANSLMYLMEGIQGTGKNGNVRDIDKYLAIAGSSLSTKEKETALYEYMSDVMDEKYTYAKRNMGLTVDDFVKAYKVTDEYSLKEDQKKAWRAMGYTAAEAENLWKLYKGKLT